MAARRMTNSSSRERAFRPRLASLITRCTINIGLQVCRLKQEMLRRKIGARRAAREQRLLHSACIRQAGRRPMGETRAGQARARVGLANIAAPAYSVRT